MPQAGFDPPFAESAWSTEWESDELMNQAAKAGSKQAFLEKQM